MSQSKHLSTIVAILLLIISCSIYHSKKSFLKIQAHGDVPAVPHVNTSAHVETNVKYQAHVKRTNADQVAYQKKARAEANARAKAKLEQSETQEEAEARAKRFADSKKALEAHMQGDANVSHGN